jgi:tetratricopeptide (TPR) repeat protein
MKHVIPLILLLSMVTIATGCTKRSNTPGGVSVSKEPLFEGLGSHTRTVTTTNAEAQRYFDQGLNLIYGFNHDEAIRSFRQAAELDSNLAMAWWGIALANGPHINNPMVDSAHAQAAWDALGRAQQHAAGASDVERAMIEALGHRYANPQPEDRKPLDLAYANAMRTVWKAHSDDADVGALFAESMMDLRPWDLWTADGKPQPETPEILGTLEAVMAKAPNHPLANHLYIHAVEASPHPEKGDAAAERLRGLQPGLGHMTHMPSHIDVRRGRWGQAITTNRAAIESDDRYRSIVPEQHFYRVYMAHNHHMLTFAAMMTGRSKVALDAIREMVAGIPAEFVKENALFIDGFMAMPIEVMTRFGRWDEILAEPEPPDHLPMARSLRHAARSVAYATKGQLADARAEQKLFIVASAKVPKEAIHGNNTATDLLAIARAQLEGELLVREGKMQRGLASLREAVKLEDKLRYDEPPDWITPVRHALGAALIEAELAAEAEKVYRQDLVRYPGNGWSLFGLKRSLQLMGKRAEAQQAEAQFREAWKDADVQIGSSCFCQPGTAGVAAKTAASP